jgi:hypothetical protein
LGLNIGSTIVLVLAIFLTDVLAQAIESARTAHCMAQMRQQSLGILMYAQDYDGNLPNAEKWMDLAWPYIKNEEIFHCPSVSKKDPSAFGYAFNDKLSRKNIEKIGDQKKVILIYESLATERNAHDAVTSIPPKGRHLGGNNIAYAEGFVKWVRVTKGGD